MKTLTIYSNDDVRHLCFPSTDRTITFPHHRHRTLISVTYCNAREPLLVMSTRRHSRSAYRTSVFSLSLSLSLSLQYPRSSPRTCTPVPSRLTRPWCGGCPWSTPARACSSTSKGTRYSTPQMKLKCMESPTSEQCSISTTRGVAKYRDAKTVSASSVCEIELEL